jgi:hypothetical protein
MYGRPLEPTVASPCTANGVASLPLSAAVKMDVVVG